jgi:alginate O-acetyltransferase complex protein AlgI
MLFNSFSYILFLLAVFVLYWILQRSLRLQNLLLLAAGYFFYGTWDSRFVALLIAGGLADYLVAMGLEYVSALRWRRAILFLSVATNIGVLVLFKYFDFFVGSVVAGLRALGLEAQGPALNVLLPLGISFYTLQSLGYVIDVYKRRIPACRDLVNYLTFHSFFPQLLAGPIERGAHLLPQIAARRRMDLDLAKDGARQILGGLLKKVFIADNLAGEVDRIFASPWEYGGLSLVIGLALCMVQIYCDFSAYSDVALGSAKLLGIRLTPNFAYPLFASSIPEFWRRWHMTLFAWFSAFVFLPLGGIRRDPWVSSRNVLITFVLIGLWHGASWRFVAWGLLNGLVFIPFVVTRRGSPSSRLSAESPSSAARRLRERLSGRVALVIFLLAAVLLFRAPTLASAGAYAIAGVANLTSLAGLDRLVLAVVTCAILLLWEWKQRSKEHPLDIASLPTPARWATYYVVIALMFLFGSLGARPFVYFQF